MLKFKLGIPNAYNFLESYVEVLSPNIEPDEKVRLKQNSIKVLKKSVLDRKKAFLMKPSKLATKVVNKVIDGDEELKENFDSYDFLQSSD